MKFIKILIISALSFAISQNSPASAHQPVLLLNSDTTAANGPLLVDGTVSFAVRASFSKAREKKGFRAALNSGDQLSVQYLIVDKKPENSLKTTQFPTLVITTPTGVKSTNNSAERCWTVISGDVYDLTKWITSHPGGQGSIISLCGRDGTASFFAMHGNQSKPQSRLVGYLL